MSNQEKDARPRGKATRERIERADTLSPDLEPTGQSTAPPITPPGAEALVTSARLPTIPPSTEATGSMHLADSVVPEALARDLLLRRFTEAGLSIQPDYPFHGEATSVILDGFDPRTKIGYQYVSHTDADVVTDHDDSVDLALGELAASGDARVLVVHDREAPTEADLDSRIESFLGKLNIPRPS